MNQIIQRTGTTALLLAALVTSAIAQNTAHFKDADKVWSHVTGAMVSFDKVVKAKKWKQVHEAAFEVRDQALLMSDASMALGKDKIAKLKEHLKEIQKVAGELDEAGDANNGKLVTSLAAKFHMHVNMIPMLYPRGALSMKAAMHDAPKKGHHGHK